MYPSSQFTLIPHLDVDSLIKAQPDKVKRLLDCDLSYLKIIQREKIQHKINSNYLKNYSICIIGHGVVIV